MAPRSRPRLCAPGSGKQRETLPQRRVARPVLACGIPLAALWVASSWRRKPVAAGEFGAAAPDTAAERVSSWWQPAVPPALAFSWAFPLPALGSHNESWRLHTPAQLQVSLPVPGVVRRFVEASRAQAGAVLRGEDDRLLAIVGPCSIHDAEAVREYAHRLLRLAKRYGEDLFVLMRGYLEKPRTSVGWRGIVTDPDLSGNEDVERGIALGRHILLDINVVGLPVATEFLDPLFANFVEDLVAYGSIGARTTESPMHRSMAAGLGMPVGFKNTRSGDVQSAVNAILAAETPHRYLATDDRGHLIVRKAAGNPAAHVVLRGGEDGTNFDNASISQAAEMLEKAGRGSRRLVVDCSHANSKKRHEGQLVSCGSVAEQVAKGADIIGGVMIESFLKAGSQKLEPGVTNVSALVYGQSVTDACLDFEHTEVMLDKLAQASRFRRLVKKDPRVAASFVTLVPSDGADTQDAAAGAPSAAAAGPAGAPGTEGAAAAPAEEGEPATAEERAQNATKTPEAEEPRPGGDAGLQDPAVALGAGSALAAGDGGLQPAAADAALREHAPLALDEVGLGDPPELAALSGAYLGSQLQEVEEALAIGNESLAAPAARPGARRAGDRAGPLRGVRRQLGRMLGGGRARPQ